MRYRRALFPTVKAALSDANPASHGAVQGIGRDLAALRAEAQKAPPGAVLAKEAAR